MCISRTSLENLGLKFNEPERELVSPSYQLRCMTTARSARELIFFWERTSEVLRPSLHTAARLRAVSLPPNTSLPRGGTKILFIKYTRRSENGHNGRCRPPNGIEWPAAESLLPSAHRVHCVDGDTALQILHHLLDNAHSHDLLGFPGGAANVRRGQYCLQRQQWIAGRGRLGLEYVDRGSRHFAGLDRTRQRLAVDQFSAGAVDDPHTRLHLGEDGIVQHPIGFLGDRHMQCDVIALRVQLVQTHERNTQVRGDLRVRVRGAGDDRNYEATGALGHFLADVAQSQNPQRLAAQFGSHELLLFPLAGFGGRIRLGDRPSHAQHQSQGVLGHRDSVAAGSVHHQHARGGSSRKIDVVHAHARASDHSQLGRLREYVGVHFHRTTYEERFRIPQVLCVFFWVGNDDVPTRLRLQ